MDLLTLEWIGAVLGVLASLIAVHRWVWPLLKQGYKNIMGYDSLSKRMTTMSAKMDFLVSEMQINGGSSVKDHLCRIEDCVVLANEIQHARMLDSPDMIFRTDEYGSLLWINRTYARIVKRLPIELENNGWYNIIAEEQRDRVTEKWEDAISEGRELELTLDLQTPDGSTFPAVLRTYRMKHTQKNKTIGYLGTITRI
jgi:PAS domain S-box-containing protein